MRSAVRTPIYFMFLALGLCSSFAQGQTASQFPPKTEELQKRVKEFYSLLQQGKVSQAETYVTKDTIETFRMMKVNPFIDSELQSIDLDPSGKTATVLAQIVYESPFVPGAKLRYPRQTTWRLDRGEWRIVVEMTGSPSPPEPPPGATVQTLPPGTSPNAPQKEDLQFEQKDGNLGVIQEGDKKEIRFAFKNGADHPVKIVSVETGCNCLKVLSGVKSYEPGESGELVLQFDSTGYRFGYKQTVTVKTDPGSLTSSLLVEAQPLPTSLSQQ